MASPLKTGKQSVNLAPPAARVPGSRIRRDPPPPVKKVEIKDVEDRDRQAAVLGIIAFALAIVIVIFAFSSYAGWTPRQYVAQL